MKKRYIFLIAGGLTLPFFLLIAARLLNWYTFYTIPTTGMIPGIKQNEKVFGSSLLSVRRNDIVSYMANPTVYEVNVDPYACIGRAVAVAGDSLEIRNSFLYINGKLADDTMKLAYNFQISPCYYTEEYTSSSRLFPFDDTSCTGNFGYPELQKSDNLNYKRIVDTSTAFINASMFGPQYAYKRWTKDNFGPLLIPEDCYFILGDNRDNSADSRYRGFTRKEDIISRIIK